MRIAETSIVNGIVFPYALSDNKSYARSAGLSGISLMKFWFRIYVEYWKTDQRLAKTLKDKKCYYGPFKGEFGHFAAHTLPFLVYLHKQGVKIVYCGMELHKPFMLDEKGESIVSEFRPLRDFFKEVAPNGNSTVPPEDVQQEIRKFENEAIKSGVSFWNIGDDYYYWFIHRNWLLKGHTSVYDLKKVYKTADENACVIFPRSKGSKVSHNNGEQWDYPALLKIVSPFFDKVYICGHPSQVHNLSVDDPKVVLAVSTDNSVMLNKIANSRLIISQHSGIVYVGEYVGVNIMLIYKGGKQIQDIGSFNNTLRFKKQFPGRSKIYFAFSEEEVKTRLGEMTR